VSLLKQPSNGAGSLKPAMENAQQKFQQKQQELQNQKLLQLLKQQQIQDLKMKQLMQQQMSKLKQGGDFDLSGFIKSEPMEDDEESAGPAMDDVSDGFYWKILHYSRLIYLIFPFNSRTTPKMSKWTWTPPSFWPLGSDLIRRTMKMRKMELIMSWRMGHKF
jgi:hypothetical protein